MSEPKKIPGGQVHIWMNLLGFERDDEDKGADRFLKQTDFLPDGVCALLFHPDFVHQHAGMHEEYKLHPDNCAYNAVPRNAERARQDWTNYDLRKLCKNLRNKGCGLYAGLMGCTNGNAYHKEWISEHPELYSHYRGGVRANHCILKRFADGTYYEDFFIEKLCEALKDYGMKGVHLSDCFCPSGGSIAHGDFSTDLVTQFLNATGNRLDATVASELGNDSAEVEDRRADWIWKHLRAEWIEFLCARWTAFFKKLCQRVHAIGCEVMILGMYCTDPFETKYCMGMDLARLCSVGVDYITENILPSSCYANSKDREYRFQRYMAIAPLMAAHIRDGHLLTMLGTYDATEEWDILHHFPCLHELDIYASMAYRLETKEGSKRALEGFFVSLGDGISKEDWAQEQKRFARAMSANVKQTLSPVMLWSDTSYEKLLREYIKTRRWTPFKLFYELGKAGAMLGGCIRCEDLDTYQGAVVVADFDLLSEEEKRRVASYRGGPVLAVMPADFDIKALFPKQTYLFSDPHASHPMKAYFFGAQLPSTIREKAKSMLSEDDGTEEIEARDMADFGNPLTETLPFAKVSIGFIRALSCILGATKAFVCDVPHLAYRLTNGNIRLYLFNTVRDRYSRAFLDMRCEITDAKVISSFPLLPVRFDESKQRFEIKLAPGGVSVIEITAKNNEGCGMHSEGSI